MSLDFRKTDSFEKFLQVFSKLISKENFEIINDQWNRLPSLKDDIALEKYEKDINEFWKYLGTVKSIKGSFYEISCVSLRAMALPHSNVGPERRFSVLKDVANDKRNTLKITSIDGLLRAKDAVKLHVDNNDVFEPTQEMIDCYVRRKYIEKNKSTYVSIISFCNLLKIRKKKKN